MVRFLRMAALRSPLRIPREWRAANRHSMPIATLRAQQDESKLAAWIGEERDARNTHASSLPLAWIPIRLHTRLLAKSQKCGLNA